MAAAHAAAMLLAPELGWDDERTAAEASQFTDACHKELLTAGLDPR